MENARPKFCTAHLERLGLPILAFKLGLCRRCFAGVPLPDTFQEIRRERQWARRRERDNRHCRRYYYRNRRRLIRNRVEWGRQNRDRQLANQRAYYAAHREQMLQAKREAYARNPEPWKRRARARYLRLRAQKARAA